MKKSNIGKVFFSGVSNFTGDEVLRVVSNPGSVSSSDKDQSILLRDANIPSDSDTYGFQYTLTMNSERPGELPRKAIQVPDKSMFLEEGDIVHIRSGDGTARLSIIYRISSNDNCLVPTNQCNSGCIMCPQPAFCPDVDGVDLRRISRTIEMINKSTEFLMLSGGEPTLLKENLVEILSLCNRHLPSTRIAILTNGRLLSYSSFVDHLCSVAHKKIAFCVPIHSYQEVSHDRITQVPGSFRQTTRGISNLLNKGSEVEIRVVVQQANYDDLPRVSKYIADNLHGVAKVVFMAMEASGRAAKNCDKIWVPFNEINCCLEEAIVALLSKGIDVAIYNFPLCKISKPFRSLCADSISDYKVRFLNECDNCGKKARCGGVFAASLRLLQSEGVSPIND